MVLAPFSSQSVKGQIEEILIAIYMTFCWGIVALRFVVRYKFRIALGWDDFSMLLSLCFYSIYCAFILVIIRHGGFIDTKGYAIPDTAFASAVLLSIWPARSKLLYIMMSEVAYIVTTICLRCSFGFFFLRMLRQQWQRRIIYVALAVTNLIGVAYVFVAIFQCRNPKYFTKNALAHRCMSHPLNNGFGYTYAALTVVADWTFVIVPILMMCKARMAKRAKLAVCGILIIGSVGSIASIIRMAYVEGSIIGPGFFKSGAQLAIWSTVEPGVGIFAGSLVTLRPLLKSVLEKSRRPYETQRSNSMMPEVVNKRFTIEQTSSPRETDIELRPLGRQNTIYDGDYAVVTEIVGGTKARESNMQQSRRTHRRSHRRLSSGPSAEPLAEHRLLTPSTASWKSDGEGSDLSSAPSQWNAIDGQRQVHHPSPAAATPNMNTRQTLAEFLREDVRPLEQPVGSRNTMDYEEDPGAHGSRGYHEMVRSISRSMR